MGFSFEPVSAQGRARHPYRHQEIDFSRVAPDRPLTVCVDRIVMTIPRIGSGAFSPAQYEQLDLTNQGFMLAMLAGVTRGVAAPIVNDIMAQMCGVSVYRLPLGQMQRQLDQRISPWRERTLQIRAYPVLFLGAVTIPTSAQGEQAAVVAVAVDTAGNREVVGIHALGGGVRSNATAFLRRLQVRGLRGVEVVVTDGHTAIDVAVRNVFSEAIHQLCQTRTTRAALSVCPRPAQTELQRGLRRLYGSKSRHEGLAILAELEEDMAGRAPGAMSRVRESFDRALAVVDLPPGYRARLRTLRTVDIVIEAFDRPARVIRTFPDVTSAERLLTAVAMEVDETWTEGGRYVSIPRKRVTSRR